MAIYHLEAKIVSRGAGRSAVAAAAYLSCSRMLNEYDGVQHDYTRKQGLGWRQVFLPATATTEWQDRENLWNAVEETETAKDSRLAREFVAALPIELSREEQIQLLQDFIKEQFVADGMCADFGEPIGDFNTEYAYRELVALAGLGANTVEVALYPKIEQDADGNTLTGEKSYILHFESYPQVLEGGFWSVTAYGDDDFLIDNPIDRYCINDRSGLKVKDDSVDVILSKDAPEDTTNWLPVGDGGFHLYMRIYTPDMDALETWTAPTITEIDPSKAN